MKTYTQFINESESKVKNTWHHVHVEPTSQDSEHYVISAPTKKEALAKLNKHHDKKAAADKRLFKGQPDYHSMSYKIDIGTHTRKENTYYHGKVKSPDDVDNATVLK